MPKNSKTQRHASNIQQTTPFQYLIILIILTILNILFFFGHGSSNVPIQCSSDTLLQVVSLYLTNNGQATLRSLLPSQCSSYGNETEQNLKTSVRNLLDTCVLSRKAEVAKKRPEPLVTLFTTFADHFHSDTQKLFVHNNTLANWASFKPSVNLILFSNDTYWSGVARSHGWDVIKPLRENNGTKPPILKDMFRLAMSRYKTQWFGYVNADILLTRDLLSNLEMLTKKYNTEKSRIFLTGRRTNVENLTNLDPVSEASIEQNAKRYGRLYKEDAEDFFIATSSFPWREILPVVVGRPGYDNWLVGEARCRLNATVIDVTETLLAFHQTTKKGGNSEGHFHADSDFNYNVLKQNKIVPNFLAGLTDCIIYFTYRTFCDTIDVAKRTHFGPQCNCHFKRQHN